MKTYLAVYLGSTLLALVVTPTVIRLARRFQIVDKPGIRKVHSRPIPRMGGVAIVISAMSLILAVLFLPNIIGDSFRLVSAQVTTLLAAAAFMFFVGLIDDIKGLRARTKLLAQTAAAVAVCLAGIRIDSITVTDSLVIHLGWVSWPISILWLVGLTNAVNLVDGLDGLAAGICAATCGVIAVLSLISGPAIMPVIMFSLLGALTGFLFFNFNPAKIFMGDSGSLFLGFIIASSSILCAAKTETIVGLALPVLALGIPIFDTIFSMLRRFLERRSVFAPDRGHFHHRLLALGLRQRHVVLAAYGLTLLAVGLGMFMLLTRNAQTIVLFGCILILLLLAFRAVGAVRLRETMTGLKRKYAIAHQAKREIENFQEVELHFQQAERFGQWWQAVCSAADKMGFAKSTLPLTNRDGTSRVLAWEKDQADWAAEDVVKATLTVPDRRAGSLLSLEVQVRANGSLESAGRRIALFSRLIEQHGLAQLPRTSRSAGAKNLDYQMAASSS
jgi:UDP-GlcNAc:undecaprenyl-phosphate GlcNAc-1-phosphate transferase